MLVTFSTQAQLLGQGGGSYQISHAECISPAQQKLIWQDVQQNIKTLELKGALQKSLMAPPKFRWPVKQAGTTYKYVYGIGNYVDYNCGTRTYDITGYNHQGIDIFLWPYPWKMKKEGAANIVAAAAGTIVGKYDGNADNNCGFGSGNWNAVYVQHADGSIAWYGHMKKNSLTNKVVGNTVAIGEKLGKVGSSGNSTGPHLHFEVYNASNTLIDPYQGACNTLNNNSWWKNQLPYYDSHLNHIATHSTPPVYPSCPTIETTNEATSFVRGNVVYFASYFHDQVSGSVASYRITRPNGTTYSSWNNTFSVHYAASYWYWYFTIASNEAVGTWQYRCIYNGDTIVRNFNITATARTVADEPDANTWLHIYPNIVTDHLHFDYSIETNTEAHIIDATGRLIKTTTLNAMFTETDINVSTIKPGVYMLIVANEKQRFIKQ